MAIAVENREGTVGLGQVRGALQAFFTDYDCAGKRIILIVPDNTRSGPVGDVFQLLFECIGDQTAALDVLVALGTHPPLSEEQICTRLSMTMEERQSRYRQVKFFNHEWKKPETFTSLGKISAEDIGEISAGLFSEAVDVTINRMIFDYDEFFILGPVFPHEVVGFSGGHKYLFPGISGPEIIHFYHWLGAVITNPQIIGTRRTPTREVVEKAASFIDMPRKLIALVAVENDLKGLYIGEVNEVWEQAAALSEQVHIIYKERPYHTVVGIAAEMYDDIWTAGKAMYKLEPVVADGGTLIIYAPHITELSYSHGKILDKIGYHTRDYFLKQMDRFKGLPRGVIAHSTHVKGIGTFIDGVEKPRVQVILATRIPRERCEQINLGYLNPDDLCLEDYRNREDEGVLVVDHAGEMLYRLADCSLPTIAPVVG